MSTTVAVFEPGETTLANDSKYTTAMSKLFYEHFTRDFTSTIHRWYIFKMHKTSEMMEVCRLLEVQQLAYVLITYILISLCVKGL